MTSSPPTIGVGMIGHAFMGAAHSQAWRSAPHFFDLPLVPRMTAIAGRNRAGVDAAAQRLGWESAETDWHALIDRPDIGLIDICTPGDTHAQIALAALRAGKHVLCEKPLANSVAEAEEMAAAAQEAARSGVVAMVGFTYRRVPAIQLARTLVADGRLGTVRHVRAQYLQDWLSDPESPWTWRMDRDRAGSGALGDIGAHIVDLTQFILGRELTQVTGRLATFVDRRPLPDGGTGEVTVDDTAAFLGEFEDGVLGVYEATRYALGRKNAIRVEINGSRGSLAFDFEDMNVLHFHDGDEAAETAGFRRIVVTEPVHAYVGNWWPAGHGLGYEHGFTHQVVDLLRAIAGGAPAIPDFTAGLQVQRVLAAVERSEQTRGWESVAGPGS
ncbi:Gfo/Idh/MocA family oxidoreductase [Nakamurella flavida]|uniref:Gfo/Idh/MocA family oxidoreductase n=1 Tax=Nakamurella flavida TaxID=363630 RepID=A0A938YGK4_9ACTN|nr:Gfo/Idh/MocA family oxidoreductase [Nakamurella flavida]MBM9475522.1 Gfo/Idh/MocA family oxidoreductase [Nakamurella flavida]MDP9778203.1 putative dehydrogenase [Nakamurella flavida]